MTAALFLATTLAVAGAWVWMARRAFGDRGAVIAAVGIAAWLGFTGVLGATAVLDSPGTLPPPALVPVMLASLACLGFTLSPPGVRLAGEVPLAVLVGFQAFRIPVEIGLWRLHAEGIVPIEMTFESRNFDILSGITAVIVAAVAGRVSGRIVLAWNVLGLALLFNIVGIAVISILRPTDGPTNQLPFLFPYAWLPYFLVVSALFGHLLVFRRLSGRPTAP